MVGSKVCGFGVPVANRGAVSQISWLPPDTQSPQPPKTLLEVEITVPQVCTALSGRAPEEAEL